MADDYFPVTVPLELTRQGTTPASPLAGTIAVYAKTDDHLYTLTSGGGETQVGAGASSRTFAFFQS